MSESFIFQILAIVGGVLAVIGSINAYLLRVLTEKINTIHIDLVATKTEFIGVTSQVTKNESKIELVRIEQERSRIEQERTRMRLHTLEGSTANMFSYIKDEDERKDGLSLKKG